MVDLPGASPSKKRVPFSLRSHQASIASQLRVRALEPLLRLSYVSEKHELICWSKRCPWFSLELRRVWCFTAQAGRTRLNVRCPSRQGITLRRLCQGPFHLSHRLLFKSRTVWLGRAGEKESFLFLLEHRVSLRDLSWPLSFCHSPASASWGMNGIAGGHYHLWSGESTLIYPCPHLMPVCSEMIDGKSSLGVWCLLRWVSRRIGPCFMAITVYISASLEESRTPGQSRDYTVWQHCVSKSQVPSVRSRPQSRGHIIPVEWWVRPTHAFYALVCKGDCWWKVTMFVNTLKLVNWLQQCPYSIVPALASTKWHLPTHYLELTLGFTLTNSTV